MTKIAGMTAVFSVWAGQLLAGTSYSIEVPEVGTTGSVAALAVIGAVGALVWERRRNRRD